MESFTNPIMVVTPLSRFYSIRIITVHLSMRLASCCGCCFSTTKPPGVPQASGHFYAQPHDLARGQALLPDPFNSDC